MNLNMSNDSIDSILRRARLRTSAVEDIRVTKDKDQMLDKIISKSLVLGYMQAPINTKPYKITHGWTGPYQRLNGLNSEPKTQHLLDLTISPFASIGARLSLRLAGSSCRNFLSGIKQTWDESKDSLSEANVPLNHVIEVLLVIFRILLATMNDS